MERRSSLSLLRAQAASCNLQNTTALASERFTKADGRRSRAPLTFAKNGGDERSLQCRARERAFLFCACSWRCRERRARLLFCSVAKAFACERERESARAPPSPSLLSRLTRIFRLVFSSKRGGVGAKTLRTKAFASSDRRRARSRQYERSRHRGTFTFTRADMFNDMSNKKKLYQTTMRRHRWSAAAAA